MKKNQSDDKGSEISGISSTKESPRQNVELPGPSAPLPLPLSSPAVPISLKWGKTTFTAPSSSLSPIQPGSNVLLLKHEIQALTNVPVHRQKLLSKGWKGMLVSKGKDDDEKKSNEVLLFPSNLSLPKGKDTLLVTLIGSADVLIETKPEDRPKFEEDMTAEEREAERSRREAKDIESSVGDIVALQLKPGRDRSRDLARIGAGTGTGTDGKMMSNIDEMIPYNRLVTGLPQWQIEEKLRIRLEEGKPELDHSERPFDASSSSDDVVLVGNSHSIGTETIGIIGNKDRKGLMGEVAMTMGLELRRAYVNSLAVLHNGTLVSGLDDGHVHLWRRGELVKDAIHCQYQGGDAGGVDHVVSLAMVPDSDDLDRDLDLGQTQNNRPAFATGGRGLIRIWTVEGEGIVQFHTPFGTTPTSLVAGSISPDLSLVSTGGNNSSNCNTRIDGDDMHNANQSASPLQHNNSNDPTKKKPLRYLACCCRVTRQPDPNQFRLVPQDEAGRMRRATAVEQERQLQSRLSGTSKCVQYWIYDDSESSNGNFGAGTIYPHSIPMHSQSTNNGESNEMAAAVVELAVSNDYLVCGDQWGGLRIMKWTYRDNHHASGRVPFAKQAAYLQLFYVEEDGIDCSISRIEHIQENILAVATSPVRILDGQEGSRVIPFARELRVTNPRAVYIIDFEKPMIRAVLDAHTDTVQCICPLPSGGILTAGGKLDATVRVWEASAIANVLYDSPRTGNKLQKSENLEDSDVAPAVLTEAKKLNEPGYVFDLRVLPNHSNNKDGSDGLYAVAAARYNVVKIII